MQLNANLIDVGNAHLNLFCDPVESPPSHTPKKLKRPEWPPQLTTNPTQPRRTTHWSKKTDPQILKQCKYIVYTFSLCIPNFLNQKYAHWFLLSKHWYNSIFQKQGHLFLWWGRGKCGKKTIFYLLRGGVTNLSMKFPVSGVKILNRIHGTWYISLHLP